MPGFGTEGIVNDLQTFGRSTVGSTLEELGLVHSGWASGAKKKSKRLFAPRGSIATVIQTDPENGSATPGMYFIEPFLTQLNPEAYVPVTLLGPVSVSDGDIVNPSVAFNSRQIFHVYGRDVKTISINGMMLLGDGYTMYSRKPEEVLDAWFDKYRVSAYKKAIVFGSFATSSANHFILTSLTKNGVDPDLHILNFTISGFLVSKNEGFGVTDLLDRKKEALKLLTDAKETANKPKPSFIGSLNDSITKTTNAITRGLGGPFDLVLGGPGL